MVVCASCGSENAERAKFCSECGAALTADGHAPAELRKLVTVVFCDVTGSTTLGERLDPETLRKVMTRYFETMRAALEHHGGTVEKFIGDAVMAVFGVPVTHEDDALRAVRATAEMRSTLTALNEELGRDQGVTIEVRMGVHTGEVVAGDPTARQAMVSGDTGNVAARLEQAAAPGDVLISEQTYRFVRDAVTVDVVEPLVLKGKSQPVAAYRVLGVDADAVGHARRLDSPFVGRGRELALLRQTLDRVASDRACQLFTVLGVAGVGKSRLVQEFVAGIEGPAHVLQGRCLPYGETSGVSPLVEVVRAAAGLGSSEPEERQRERLAALVATAVDADRIVAALAPLLDIASETVALSIHEHYWAARRLLEELADAGPLVLVFDDIHWAQPTFLDLLDHITDFARDAPILLVCLARPELLDVRPGWGGGKFNETSMLLEPLDDADSRRLLANLLATEPPAPIATRILAAADGNPLFVEETLGMLLDDGVLRIDDGRVRVEGDIDTVTIPATIQALLAARLDRLEPPERRTLGRAAVIGRVFYPAAVRDLAPDGDRPRSDEHLLALVRRQLIAPERSDLAREEAYRFKHGLVRDAAYGELPKESRARLHERFVRWLDQRHGDLGVEADEIGGYHLEESYRYLQELGPLDEHGEEIGREAAERLLRAGRRARGRFDVSAAADLLTRVVGLLPPDDPRRPEILLDLGDVLARRSEEVGAEGVLREAAEAAAAVGRSDLEGRASIGYLVAMLERRPQDMVERERHEAERWLPVFEQLGDHLGLAAAHRLLAEANFTLWHIEACAEHHRIAADHARVAGDRWTELDSLFMWAMFPAWIGPMGPGELRRRLDEYERRVGPASVAAGGRMLQGEALLAAMGGDVEEAIGLLDEALEAARSLGELWMQTGIVEYRAELSVQSGNASAAERDYRWGIRELTAVDAVAMLGMWEAELGYTLALQGRADEALAHAERAVALSDPDDVSNAVGAERARAIALAHRGDVAGAERSARAALALLERTDGLGQHGDLLLDLAFVLVTASRTDEAIEAVHQAIAMYERKGDLGRLERGREALAELMSTGMLGV